MVLKETYAQRKRDGLCVKCTDVLDHTDAAVLCNTCRAAQSRRDKARRARHKKQGTCRNGCGKKAIKSQIYCEDCNNNHNIRRAKWDAENWIAAKIRRHRHHDRKSKRAISKPNYLTIAYGDNMVKLQDWKCYYCESPMQTEDMTKPDGLTFDRILNSQPHHCENCVAACAKCNRKHGRMEIDSPKFLEYLTQKFKISSY